MKMESLHFKWNRSIAFRFTALLLCVLIPVSVMVIVLYSIGYDSIRGQTETTAQAALDRLESSLNNQIKALYSDLTELTGNLTLSRIVYLGESMPSYTYYQEVYDLQTQFAALRGNNKLIDKINLYINSANILISVDENRSHGTFDIESFNQMVSLAKTYGNTSIIAENDSLSISIIMPSSCYYSEHTPTYVIEMELSPAYLSRFISNYSYGNTAIYYNCSNAWFLGNDNSLDGTLYQKAYDIALRDVCIGDTNDECIFEFSDEATDYLATIKFVSSMQMTFLRLIPRSDAMQVLDNYRKLLLVFIFISISAFVICCVLYLRLFSKPITSLVKGFQRIENEDYLVHVFPQKNAGEITYLMNGFNHMATKLNETFNRLYKQQLYMQQMELKQLQMQINPHFLYNSYFMLRRMLEQGNDESAKMLSGYLGEYFKYITRNAKDRISLYEEYQHVYSYVKIQQLRYERRMSIHMQELTKDIRNISVPRLILQPLMENAIEHGLEHICQGGIASMNFAQEPPRLYIIVEDNGQDTTDCLLAELRTKLKNYDSPGQDATALINIHRRIQICFGPKFGISVSRSRLGGMRIELSLPLTKE